MTAKDNKQSPSEDPTVMSEEKSAVLYGVDDVPAPHLCLLFGLQQAIMCIGGTLSVPFIVSDLICARERDDVTSRLLSITMFMCGVATLLQTTFGIRLGIIQGGSHTFIAPIVAMMSIDRWQCDHHAEGVSEADVWKERMREIQGSLMLASVTQLVLGCTGLMGFFMQFIGPLTIAPTISLIGLSLTGVAADFNRLHWGIAFLTMGLIIIFSLYLGGVKIPMPTWNRERGCHFSGYPLFQLFPLILSIAISWLFCYILTATEVLPSDPDHPNFKARTDARLSVVKTAPWFYWPYPFQFGVPTVTVAGYIGFLAATLSSIMESIGDYYACARISGAPPPPSHAINRGIAIEGLSSIVSGMVGAGHGTTSYSGNIGAIGITKVASRRVFFIAGLILVICGVIGKFGAIITLIPDPIIGGTLTVVFGMVAAVGVSTLKYIDMGSTRNLTILGTSLLLGLMVPQWINNPVNAATIQTGNDELDQVIKVLGGTAMFVGGTVGFVLDNTVPGSAEERGILRWRHLGDGGEIKAKMYEFPYVTKYIRKIQCCSYVPVCPTFNKTVTLKCWDRKKQKRETTGLDNTVDISDEGAYQEADKNAPHYTEHNAKDQISRL